MALTDTLDDLITERRIEPQLAIKIVANFDRAITEVLADKVKARLTFKVGRTRLRMMPIRRYMLTGALTDQGHLDTYRFCDEVWTFLIKDINFKLDNSTIVHADKVKIVSCNAKKPGEV